MESTQCTALPSEKDHATATGNIYRKYCEIWTYGFSDVQGYRQTDRQTHWWSQYFAPLSGAT